MTTPSFKRGSAPVFARRVAVRTTAHYNVMQLSESPAARPQRLSPAALWILLAYLPPEVRARPWVRHLVEQQLARAEDLPALDRPAPLPGPTRQRVAPASPWA